MRLLAVFCAVTCATAAGQDEPPQCILDRAKAESYRDRLQAINALSRYDGIKATEALRSCLGDGVEAVRHAAAVALSSREASDEAVVTVLSQSLAGDTWYVRWQACLALKRIAPHATGAVPALMAALNDEKIDVSREVGLALAAIAPRGDKAVVTGLARAFVAGRGGGAILHALAMSSTPICNLDAELSRALPQLVELLRNADEATREDAQRALQTIGAPALAGLVCRIDWEWTRIVDSQTVERAWRSSVRLSLPSDDRDYASLVAILSDSDVGDDVLHVLEATRLTTDPTAELVRCVREGTLDRQRTAILLLGSVGAPSRDVRDVLGEATEQAELKRCAVKALLALENRVRAE